VLILASWLGHAQSLLVPGGVNYVQGGDIDVSGSQITVEALVTTNGGGVNIVSKHTDPSNVNYLMRPGSAEITTTNGYVNAVSGFVLTPGVCYHLAFTYDGNSLDYYVNGCLASSTPHTGNLVTNNLITAIGDQSNCQCESWNGYIDEVRIWNVARTQAQIQANMFDIPNPTIQPGLLAYYKFDGNYLNLQGNAAFNGNPIGAPQLVTNNACQNVDLSFQNSVTVTDVNCNGGADGSVTITSTGGHPNYQYSADGINYFPINSIGNLPVGNGVVWASSGAGGCIEQIPITIGEPAPITTSVSGTGPSCLGNDGQADLTVNGGTPPYSYVWSSGSAQQDPTNLAVGNSTVTITDANGCTATESVTLSAPPSVSATATGTDPTCYGANDGTADVTVNSGTAPFTFQWSTGSTAEDPTNLVAGGNIYTVTDANSCTYTDSVVLAQPNSLLSSATAAYVSSGGACDASAVANPTGGTPPYTYLWSNGATTQSVNGLCQGLINVTVTDANGCVTTQPLNVNLPQCLTDVDFYTWVQAGQPANGNWVVQAGGTQVLQTVNGNPTFFITPADYINVRMNGRFRTTDNDDDWMGIVFGFKQPLGASDTYDTWLFDWKQETQASGGFTGQEGFALTHVTGTIPTNQYAATFWGHTTTPQFNVVATNYGNNGWNQNTWYDVEVVYTVNRAIILVDGDTIFDVVDCFEPGRFGFYNYSQRQVTYADFTYELFADFVVETPEICAGDTAQFTFLEQCGNFNNLSQFDELHWDYGDGTSEVVSSINMTNVNPEHIYQSGGNYTVRLIALDTLGCRDTVFKSILVHQNPTAEFTFTDQCFQDLTQFTDASQQGDFPIVGHAWLINGSQVIQQNTSYQFPAPATYVVGLGVQDAFGCIDTVIHSVPIHVLPTADFSPIDDCFEPNYPFQDASIISSGSVVGWQWDFSDGGTSTSQNPTHTFAAYGQYDVELIAVSDQGCGDTLNQTVTLHEIPTPGFEIPNICQLEPMQLMDTSSVTDGTIVSWHYDMGDGSSSNAQHPVHLYQNSGNIVITQTVTTSFGCEATVQQNAVVRPKPQADFAALDVCLDDDMFFNDQSSVVSGTVDEWSWNFDDGSIDSIADPTHMYTNAGTYDVQLIVESDFGCLDTVVQQVEVFQLPVADFSFSNVCLADAAVFTDQSTSGSGSVSSWNWDLGDGNTSVAQGPIVHDYAVPSTYTVQLIVETGVGCLDTAVQDIVVYPMPEADFVADSVCFGLPTNFTDLSSILTGSITNYFWDFGFTASSSIPEPSNVFPQTGYHDVTLVLTSDFGCKDTITKPIRVYVLPEPEFVHNDTCFEDNVSFVNLSSISEGTIAAYLWDFGDAQTSTLPSPVHHYGAAGFYTTDLIAVSNYGCTDSVSHQVEIYPLPTVAFTPVPNEGCQLLTVTFNNDSDIPSGYFISTYNWLFGQGDISTSEDPQTVYPDSGLYTVTLIVTTANGCDDTLTIADAVDVWPRPIAGFETDKDEYLMYFPTVQCLDQSVGATEWFWDFADGSQSQDQNPEHEYQQDGVYQIIQTVYNDYGCEDITSRRVIVKPAITFYIPNSFTPNDDGVNETFIGYGEGITEYEMWVFDRWGENIFYSASKEEGWDGTYKGQPVESGVYVYKFFILDVSGNDHIYTGGVHLLR
jgi:gliding motility-associated-like protein